MIEILTVKLHNQWGGFELKKVAEVIEQQKYTEIPGSPEHILGVLNLRGKIVTLIDLRKILCNCPMEAEKPFKIIVLIDEDGEHIAAAVEEAGRVIRTEESKLERIPEDGENLWAKVGKGVLRVNDDLVTILDHKKILRGKL